MENLSMLLHGFSVVLTFENVLVCLIGALLGLVVGAMPGIGSLAGVALLLAQGIFAAPLPSSC